MRSDLLKMHAYRDAIRRTAGAYVLYPGEMEIDRTPFVEYHELLPGLGAFVLRPSAVGAASGTNALKRFLDDVLNHVATRLTAHERGRYWQQEIFGEQGLGPIVPGIEMPPPDTRVLLGYVKNSAHWSWIVQRKAYNVRTEERTGGVREDALLLQSQLVMLYCPELQRLALARIVSGAERISLEGMRATAYPEPRGEYWCVQLSFVDRPDWLAGLSASSLDDHVRGMGLARGQPLSETWGALQALVRT